MQLTRRDLGKLALAPLAGKLCGAVIDSKFYGVQFGAITYSFNSIAGPDPQAIVRAFVEVGLGEAELMSNHCEALAGAPSAGRGGRRGAPLTPEQQAERQAQQEALRNWRHSTSAATWRAVRQKFNDAGVEVALLCYNMNDSMQDEDIEYGFSMAEGLGAKAISTSTTLTMARRIAPVAEHHKMLVGYHGHDATNDPNQTATLESYDTLMAYGKYNGVNLDIGHFTAANYDAVAFIQRHHDKITNLHVKDMKRDHGAYTPFGEGDTPIKGVLQLLKKEKYGFPANLELEYRFSRLQRDRRNEKMPSLLQRLPELRHRSAKPKLTLAESALYRTISYPALKEEHADGNQNQTRRQYGGGRGERPLGRGDCRGIPVRCTSVG